MLPVPLNTELGCIALKGHQQLADSMAGLIGTLDGLHGHLSCVRNTFNTHTHSWCLSALLLSDRGDAQCLLLQAAEQLTDLFKMLIGTAKLCRRFHNLL